MEMFSGLVALSGGEIMTSFSPEYIHDRNALGVTILTPFTLNEIDLRLS